MNEQKINYKILNVKLETTISILNKIIQDRYIFYIDKFNQYNHYKIMDILVQARGQNII